MGFHAKIAAGIDAFGNERVKVAPRVRVTPRNVQSGTQYGTDINMPGDRRGTLGMASPITAPHGATSEATGKTFVSLMARSIVAQGEWTFYDVHEGMWMIRTQMGYVRIVKGLVILNRERLGFAYQPGMAAKANRDRVLTAIIAGTVPTSPVAPPAKTPKGQRKAKAMPSEAHGGICPTCYVAMPERTGVCDYCQD